MIENCDIHGAHTGTSGCPACTQNRIQTLQAEKAELEKENKLLDMRLDAMTYCGEGRKCEKYPCEASENCEKVKEWRAENKQLKQEVERLKKERENQRKRLIELGDF